MTELNVDCAGAGHICISDEVLAIIAGTAALEIEGVAGMAGNMAGDIALILGYRNLSKGVTVKVEDGNVTVHINLLVKFGFSIRDVCSGVQKKVKSAIENMTGLNASQIDVNVMGVLYAKPRRRSDP